MKKILLALVLLLTSAALAEGGIALDQNGVLYGMERSWAQGYAPTIANGTLSLSLPLVSVKATGRLKATLLLDDPTVTPFRDQDMFVYASRNEDGIYPVRFRLKLLTGYTNGDHLCHIRVTGKDKDGEALSLDMPLLLRVRSGSSRYAELRPEISGVTADLWAGKSSPLKVKLTNPYPDVEMRDMLLTVTEEKGEVLCEASDIITLGTLAPKASMDIEVPLRALPTASIKPHALKFGLTFTALDGKRTWEQSFNLPVSQELRLEQGGVQMTSSALQGEPASLTLPLMNMGRGELRNVYAALTLSGLVEGQSVLVGTIPSGETKQAKISWSIARDAQTGEHAGTLRVTGEDEWGNSTGFDLPVSLTVEERIAEPETDVMTTALNAASDARMSYALAGVCAALLIAFIAQGILLRKKLRSVEEGRL